MARSGMQAIAGAAAIDRLYKLDFPALPNGAVMNIGQISGGNIYNAIPQELYFTVDLRSSDPALLDSLEGDLGVELPLVAPQPAPGEAAGH